MRRTFTDRLARIERRLAPSSLPTVLVVPADEPERSEVLADIERRRARGENIIAIGEHDDPMAALVEAFAP